MVDILGAVRTDGWSNFDGHIAELQVRIAVLNCYTARHTHHRGRGTSPSGERRRSTLNRFAQQNLRQCQPPDRPDQEAAIRFLRDALYMPDLIAAGFNPDLRQKYQTMIEAGKPSKVALTALMRKLIQLANALVQQDREWGSKTA